MDFIPDPNGKAVAAAVAGAAGGVVRWLTLREPLWPNSITNVTVGSITAIYLGPIAIPLLGKLLDFVGLDGLGAVVEDSNLGGFLIGMGGVTVSNLVIDAWAIRRKQLEAKNETPD